MLYIICVKQSKKSYRNYYILEELLRSRREHYNISQYGLLAADCVKGDLNLDAMCI